MLQQRKFPCPSCGFRVFEEPSGSYGLCPICSWEDDPGQLSKPWLRGGTNASSLKEYQDHILLKIPIGIELHDGFLRDRLWRPLSPSEWQHPDSNEDGKSIHGKLVFEMYSGYYWLKRSKLLKPNVNTTIQSTSSPTHHYEVVGPKRMNLGTMQTTFGGFSREHLDLTVSNDPDGICPAEP